VLKENFSQIRAALQKSLFEILAPNFDDSGRLQPQEQVNVLIVAPIYSSFASGIIVHLAYLLQSIFNAVAADGKIEAILLISEHRPDGDINSIWQLNSYAAIREIHHFMNCFDRGYSFECSQGKIEIFAPPFDFCYLIDCQNKEGQTFPNMETVVDMVATTIDILTLTTFRQKLEAEREVFKETKYDSRCRCFGAIGWSALSFPEREVLEACSLRFAKEMCGEEYGLAKEAESEGIASEVEDFLSVNFLSYDASFEKILFMPEGGWVMVQIANEREDGTIDKRDSLYKKLTRTKLTELLDVIHLRDSELQNVSLPQALQRIQSNAEKLISETKESLKKHLKDLFDTQNAGLSTASLFCDRMGEEIDNIESKLGKRQESKQLAQKKIESEVEKSKEALHERIKKYPKMYPVVSRFLMLFFIAMFFLEALIESSLPAYAPFYAVGGAFFGLLFTLPIIIIFIYYR
jgi:archaellum component FlaC